MTTPDISKLAAEAAEKSNPDRQMSVTEVMDDMIKQVPIHFRRRHKYEFALGKKFHLDMVKQAGMMKFYKGYRVRLDEKLKADEICFR